MIPVTTNAPPAEYAIAATVVASARRVGTRIKYRAIALICVERARRCQAACRRTHSRLAHRVKRHTDTETHDARAKASPREDGRPARDVLRLGRCSERDAHRGPRSDRHTQRIKRAQRIAQFNVNSSRLHYDERRKWQGSRIGALDPNMISVRASSSI